VLLTVFLGAVAPGCGKVADHVAKNDGDGSGGSDDGGGVAPGEDASDLQHPARADAGAAQGSGGTPGVEPASTGGTAAGGASNGADASSVLDPHAEQRRQLAEGACGLAAKFPCLTVTTDTFEQSASTCRAQTEGDSYARYGTSCWDEWVAYTQCAIDYTNYCPCKDADDTHDFCTINPQVNNFGRACLDQKAALDACEASLDNVGTENGTAGEFFWQAAPNGSCQALSIEEPDSGHTVEGRVQAICTGAPAGGQSCHCSANGYEFYDLVDLTLSGGAYVPWNAADCQDVARQLAAGKCTTQLNCCFRYSQTTLDGTDVDTCGCGSDPSRAGYASCEEFAAAAHGTLVDTCVEWETQGHFPIQPKS
jgi:hypothetical protein